MKTLSALLVTLLLAAPAQARPRAVPVFAPGQAPSRPMEVLSELSLEVSAAGTQAAALEQLRQQAQQLGADAVLDVVVEVRKDTTAAQLAAVPMVLLGSLVSVMSLSPRPLEDTLHATRRAAVHQTVRVVKGVAVKYVR